MKVRKISGKIVAIGINSTNIKMCEVAFKGETLNVFKSISVKTPEFSFEDGIIKDYAAIVKAINDAFRENKIKTKRVSFSVQSSKILSKEIVIPALGSKKRILSHVTTNSGEYFPVSTEDCVYSYSLLDEFVEETDGKPAKKMRIMAYAVANEIINSRYELAKQLGLKVVSVDYVGNTIAEVCKRQVPLTASMTLLINDNRTTVSVFNERCLKMQRSISSGVGMIVGAIARSYNITEEEAHKMLETTSLKTVVQEKPLVADTVEDYFNSILRVYEFYRTKYSDIPIEEAFIFGKGGELIDIAEFFEAQIDVPVNTLEKLLGIERVVEGVEEPSETTANNIRLFRYIDVLGSVFGTLDFVSKEMEGDRVAKSRNRVYLSAVVASIVVAAVLVFMPLFDKLNLQQDKESKERELAMMDDPAEYFNRYSLSYAKYADIISFYGTTETQAEAFNDFIEALELMRPENSKIKSLSCTAGGDIAMSVVADSWDTCAKFKMQIEAMTFVDSVSVTAITQTTEDDGSSLFTFSASCKISNDYIDPDVVYGDESKGGMTR